MNKVINCDFHSALIEAILSQKHLNSIQGFLKFNMIKKIARTDPHPSLCYMSSNATPKRCLPYSFVWEEVTIQPNSDWRWQGVRISLRLSWQVADNRTMLFYSKLFKWFLDDFSFCVLPTHFDFFFSCYILWKYLWVPT